MSYFADVTIDAGLALGVALVRAAANPVGAYHIQPKRTSVSVVRRPNLGLYQRRADHGVQGYGCRQLVDQAHRLHAHQPHDVLRVVRAVGSPVMPLRLC